MSSFETLLTEIRKDTSGKSFEVFCKWFLENDPYWKTQVEKVWLWDDWPERWGADKGIDLVFKHKSGQNWAIQSKCYSDDYYIKKEDIDSFLSESNRKNIHQRLLIGSTDRIGKNARETMSGQEKPVRPLLLSDLKASGLDYPSSLKKLGSKGNKKKINKDRPYQQQAIKKVVEGFKLHDRGKLIMACGTGKTLVTLWIKEKLKPKTTLVLLPSLNLLSQTLFEWTTHSKDYFEVLCICSDTTVGKQDRNEDMKVTDAYFDVTSDVSTISQFLQLDKPKVIFCTYQSSDLVSKAQKKEEIDFVVCDEAHRCTGLSKSTFTKVLDDKNIKAKKRLFTTATPRIFSPSVKTIAAKKDQEIFGMDNENIYGPDFFEYTFGQAIDDEWLTDYQVVIVGVDEPTVKASIDERELIAIDDDRHEDAETLASKISVAKAIKDYDITRMITFHNRVKDAQNFSKDFQNVLKLLKKKEKPKGTIWTDFISGQMTTKERKIKLQQLKDLSSSDRGIVSNAKCLSEGVDVPTLDGVAFVEPKGSQIDIIQSVGRALRKSEKKNIGTIILPVFLNKNADDIKTIENSNFKPVWDVLKALRSHDERLGDELDNLRVSIGKRKKIKKSLPKKLNLDFPKSLHQNFSNSLKTKLVTYTTENWMDWYGLLNAYVEKFKVLPNSKTLFENKNLGNWCGHQRIRYKNNNLDIKKINFLNKIPTWKWSLEPEWINFADARNFARKLNLKNNKGWRDYLKTDNLPNNIPSSPDHVYANLGWVSWGDWLGTNKLGNTVRNFKPFIEARNFVRSLNLKSTAEWRQYCISETFPQDLPTNPARVYKNDGYISFGDWLGTGSVATQKIDYRPFYEARQFVRKLNLKNIEEWKNYSRTKTFPKDLPAKPYRTYKDDGWESFGDWLGTGRIANFNKVFRPFKEARKFVKNLKLQNTKEWREYALSKSFPEDLPSSPEKTYKNKGWVSYGDWLGTNVRGTQGRKFKSFIEARIYARNLNLNNIAEWKSLSKQGKLPIDIPSNPNRTYKNDGWISYYDWLSIKNLATFKTFEEARKIIRKLNITSRKQWNYFKNDKNFPNNIPKTPDGVYKDKGWISWGDWLGTGSVASSEKVFRSFKEARIYVRDLNLNNIAEWKSLIKQDKLPIDIPSNPNRTYKNDGWISYSDWLGTRRIAPINKVFRPFKKARIYARNLNLNNIAEWKSLSKQNKLPIDIPSNPNRTYKNDGWISYNDWLGKDK